MSQQPELEVDAAGTVRGHDRRSRAENAGAWQKTPSGAIARAKERKSAAIDVRRQPRQARGAATFNAILDAAGLLLDAAGPEVVTTNLIAEVAGVNIATLYQYFPSRESILLALFQRDTGARVQRVDEMLVGLGDDDNWRQRISAAVDESVRLRRDQPGAGPLRRAIRACPELQTYERESLVERARTLATELVKRGHADTARAEVAARCVLEMSTAMLEVWALGYAGGMGYHDDRVIAEMKAFSIGYLAAFLDS